jgi:hypothetical protein
VRDTDAMAAVQTMTFLIRSFEAVRRPTATHYFDEQRMTDHPREAGFALVSLRRPFFDHTSLVACARKPNAATGRRRVAAPGQFHSDTSPAKRAPSVRNHSCGGWTKHAQHINRRDISRLTHRATVVPILLLLPHAVEAVAPHDNRCRVSLRRFDRGNWAAGGSPGLCEGETRGEDNV